MIKNVLKKIKSPYTDELIQKLVEMYIESGCENSKFYKTLNNRGFDNDVDNSHTKRLTAYILGNGVDKDNLYWHSGEENADLPYLYQRNSSWIIVSSPQNPMEKKQIYSDGHLSPIYRIYLNLKGQAKQEFVVGYMSRCKEESLPYKFKFSRDDSRNDQIILLSEVENLPQNLAIVEELTAGRKLGVLPMLVGEYKDGIGIGEEYYNRLHGYTDVKLALLKTAVKKYLCDYIADFSDVLSDEEKKKIRAYINEFKLIYVERMKDKEDDEKDGYEYEDFEKKPYQKKGSIDCAKEHIDNDSEAYMCGLSLAELGRAVRKIYSRNPEHFIREVVNNFRTIGTQVWGFSTDMIFSRDTEEQFGKVEAYKTMTARNELPDGILNKPHDSLIATSYEDI